MPKKKNSPKTKKKKVTEIVEIKNKQTGKETEIKLTGNVDEPLVKKDQIKSENKTLRNVLITLGIVMILFIGGFFSVWYFSESVTTFSYRGLEFKVVDEIAPYRTEVIVKQGIKSQKYNFFIRNDPRKLDEVVPFEGDLDMYKFTVINYDQDYNCGGKGVIGLGELSAIYSIAGSEMLLDENATCDSENKYQYLSIKAGDKTKIVQEGESCYTMYVKDCEILQAQERLVIETFVWIDQNLK